MKYTIGELAKLCEMNIDTIRYYERLKLFQPDFRTKSGYRKYGPNKIKELKFINKAKTLGFTLNEIKQLIDLCKSNNAIGGDILKIVLKKINEIHSSLGELNDNLHVLSVLASDCPVDVPALECPIILYLFESKIQKFSGGA
ncbi:MAG TPA: MerR family transcriptional regulator [Thermodesulfobacteriota bacterium]|nr:MerR family transcriptional regulator [Thermodesulfobacteriota bacterium]